MSGKQLTPLVFDEWTKLQEEAKKILPEVGSILGCERDEDSPNLEWVEEKRLLTFSATLSARIIDDAGDVCKPSWVLIPKGSDTRGTLRAIVCDKHRENWMHHKDLMDFKKVKVVAHARSGKAIIVEFCFG